MPNRVLYSEEWGRRLENDFDEYMERLYENVDAEFDGDEEEVLDVTGTYFCGCSNCERRAAWTFLMLRTIEGYRDGEVEFEEVPAET